MDNFARIPVNRRRLHYPAAERGGDTLMPETHPKYRDSGVPDNIHRNAEIALTLRVAGPW